MFKIIQAMKSKFILTETTLATLSDEEQAYLIGGGVLPGTPVDVTLIDDGEIPL